MLGLAVRQGLDYNYLPATDILDGIRKVTDVLVAGVVIKYQWLLGGYVHTKKPFTNKCEGLIRINMAATYSPGWNTSTIGHKGLNFSVRYGKR